MKDWRYSIKILHNEDYELPLDILVETLLGMVICMYGATLKYGNYVNIDQMKLFQRIAYTEANPVRQLRSFIKTKAPIHKLRLNIPSAKDMAAQHWHLRKFIN